MGLSHLIHANVYLAFCAVKTLALPRKTGSSGTKFVIVSVLLILFPGISWFCFFCFFHKFRCVILSICTFKAFVVIFHSHRALDQVYNYKLPVMENNTQCHHTFWSGNCCVSVYSEHPLNRYIPYLYLCDFFKSFVLYMLGNIVSMCLDK